VEHLLLRLRQSIIINPICVIMRPFILSPRLSVICLSRAKINSKTENHTAIKLKEVTVPTSGLTGGAVLRLKDQTSRSLGAEM